MQKSATRALLSPDRAMHWTEQAVIVVAASLFVALCARVTVPLLPFTPVPLTLQNFGVLLVGLLLGSRKGFAALVVYLMEGACGLPVFSIAGQGGIAQLLGPTGGYLLAYPFAAALAGWLVERSGRSFARSALAAALGDVVLFAGGISWLYVYTHSLTRAVQFGLYWFVFAEVIKIMLAAGISSGWQRARKIWA